MGYYRCVPTQSGGGGTELSSIRDSAATIEYGNRVAPAQANNCAGLFKGQGSFNKPVFIGDDVTNCWCMFNNASSFNSPVIFGKNVNYVDGMFRYASSFNYPIAVPGDIKNIAGLFSFATAFNQPFAIPEGIISCSYLFSGAASFNQPVTIPESCNNCISMFSGATSFNQNVIVPKNVNSIQFMFNGATNFGKDVYFYTTNTSGAASKLFANGNNALRKNVHFNSAVNKLFNNTGSYSIAGASVSWTQMTGGFYNAAYNIYCYNNLIV